MPDQEYAISDLTSLDDIQELEKAKQVGEALYKHYPDHLWAVSWQGRALVVKNLAISGMYGMILDNAQRYSSSALERDAIIKAGELLERAGMKRGKWNGEAATRLEGSDPRFFQPMNKLSH